MQGNHISDIETNNYIFIMLPANLLVGYFLTIELISLSKIPKLTGTSYMVNPKRYLSALVKIGHEPICKVHRVDIPTFYMRSLIRSNQYI